MPCQKLIIIIPEKKVNQILKHKHTMKFSFSEVKVPSTIPSRCVNLVKSYTDGELTLHDYLKQMRKCKKADREFNSMHPFAGSK